MLKDHLRNNIYFQCIVLFVFSVILLYSFEVLTKQYRINDVYYHVYQSDSLQQTIQSDILERSPFKSLFYIHVQPPVIDSIRAFVVSSWDKTDGNLSKYLDTRLYLIWI